MSYGMMPSRSRIAAARGRAIRRPAKPLRGRCGSPVGRPDRVGYEFGSRMAQPGVTQNIDRKDRTNSEAVKGFRRTPAGKIGPNFLLTSFSSYPLQRITFTAEFTLISR